MREIISKIINGEYDFQAERHPLLFSCDEIVCENYAGRRLHGTFDIYTEDPDGAEGTLFCRDLRVTIDTPEFSGRQNTIRYTVDTNGLSQGYSYSGTIAVISDHGEYEIPYRIKVEGEMIESSLGEIKNLFHFANLAKSDWEGALGLFYSGKFQQILNGQDASYKGAYRGFSAYEGSERNMENFLEVARKKVRPSFAADVESVEIEVPDEDYEGTVCLIRDGWGYTDLSVEGEGRFLEVGISHLSETDFPGNIAPIPYRILRDKLCMGNNKGEIRIRDLYCDIRIPVCVDVPVTPLPENGQREICLLVENYIAFRGGKISRQEWLDIFNSTITPLMERFPGRADYRLYQVQMLITEKRTEEAEMLLKQAEEILTLPGTTEELRGYGKYLRSLLENNEEVTAKYAEEIREAYHRDEANWRLAWLLLYMDSSYAHNERKCYRLIRFQYEAGNYSPFLYLEALRVLGQSPKYMEELEEFELGLFRFALRYELTTPEMRHRYVFLASQSRYYRQALEEDLIACYEAEPSNEVLEALCHVLMQGNRVDREALAWYGRAIEKEIRLPRLYEYYMMSVDLTDVRTLPKLLLMYFAYRSNLDVRHNAFMFANVLRYKDVYKEIYNQYLPQIGEFAVEQLLLRNIDENLAFIYRELDMGSRRDRGVRDAYTELLFTWRIQVKKKEFVKVVVVNNHLNREMYYDLTDSEAMIRLYGNEYVILLEDKDGNRYMDESIYRLEQMLPGHYDPERLLDIGEHVGIVLAIAEQSGDRIDVNLENESQLRWLSSQEAVTPSYRLQLRLALTEYYFDNDLISALDEILLTLDPHILEARERETCVRIMVSRGLYEQAYDWVMDCGIEGIDYKILVRLCDRLIAHSDREYNEGMVRLCMTILNMGKYDGEILSYLLQYSTGLLKDRKELWRAADSFGLDVHKLIEEMMIQVLYTGADLKEKTDLYLEHADKNMNTELEQAYLAKLSNDYFVKQEKIPDQVFERVGYLAGIGERILTINILAYLKMSAGHMISGKGAGKIGPEGENTESHPAPDKETILNFLQRMHEEGIFMPFFTVFAEMDAACRFMSAMSFVEYRGRAGSHVVLHYVLEKDGKENGDYRREEVPQVYPGIYVKSFLLFFGERIHYYITEEDGRQERLTRSSLLEYSDEQRPEDRFGLINHLAVAHDMRDDATFVKLAEEYGRRSYIVDGLFKPD